MQIRTPSMPPSFQANVLRQLQPLPPALAKATRPSHSCCDLPTVRNMSIGNMELLFGLDNRRFGNTGDLGTGVIDDRVVPNAMPSPGRSLHRSRSSTPLLTALSWVPPFQFTLRLHSCDPNHTGAFAPFAAAILGTYRRHAPERQGQGRHIRHLTCRSDLRNHTPPRPETPAPLVQARSPQVHLTTGPRGRPP